MTTTATTTPTQIQEYQTGFAPEIAPYAQGLLGQAAAYTNPATNPYMQYQGQQVAGFTPMQQQSYDAASQLQSSPQLQNASALAGQASLNALNTNYQYNPFSAGQAQAPNLQNYQMTSPGNVSTQSFTGAGTAQQYMNPYLQASLAPQMALLGQQQGAQNQVNAAQATQAGAFGNSRFGIQNAQQNQANQLAMSNLVGQGYNNAYNTAQNQFNTEQAANLQAQLANQNMGYNVGNTNLQAMLGVQNLGAGQNLQAQLANQQANQSAANLNAQQQQFGANLGLQGLNTAMQGANTLNTLGNSQYNQNVGIIGLQNQLGGQQQQQAQNYLNNQYQNYLNAQNFPYQQMNFMSNIIRGLPMNQQSASIYQAPPSTLSQVAGLGLAAAGIGKIAGKKGGSTQDIKSRGIIDLALAKMEA